MKELIKRIQDRIMNHQKENGFETVFDFLNEDIQELDELISKQNLLPDVKTYFCEKYSIDILGERLSVVEHKGSDVVTFIQKYIDDNRVKI